MKARPIASLCLLLLGAVSGVACGSDVTEAVGPIGAAGDADVAEKAASDGAAAADAAPSPGDASASDGDAGVADGAASACSGAACAPAPTLSGEVTLCGAHDFAGTFVVKAGAKVTCATGELVVRADAVVIEAGGIVTVAPTSTRPGGLAAKACSLGSYTHYSGAAGGGYGGFGGSGGTGQDPNSGANGRPLCSGCAGPAGGPILGSPTDLVVEAGTRGGDGCKGGGPQCPQGNVLAGGRGGGVLRLQAASSIRVDGELHADGETGERYGSPFNSDSGGAGGGSGGGIALLAKTVEVGPTAVLSARGGLGSAGGVYGACTAGIGGGPFNAKGGAGGAGRVKIGSTNGADPLGTVVGSFTKGIYP